MTDDAVSRFHQDGDAENDGSSVDALSRLYQAIREDDTEGARSSIEAVAPEQLSGPLHLSVALGRAATAGRLLEAGANVHHFASRGTTALHRAARVGLGEPELDGVLAIIPRLLEAGADPTVRAAKSAQVKGTPLTYAASRGAPAVLALLLADPRAQRTKQLTAALENVGFEGLEKAQLLLERGAKPTLKALLNAGGRGRIATLLLEHGAPATEADRRGCTSLHFAVEAGSVRLVEALLSRGARPDAVTSKAVRNSEIRKGDTPSELAIRRARWWHRVAVERILRAVDVNPHRVPGDQVSVACSGHAPSVEGVWGAGISFCESIGDDAAAARLADPSFRADPHEGVGKSFAALADAERILTMLDVRWEAPIGPVVPVGTWPLRAVIDDSMGFEPVENLSTWLGGAHVALELRGDRSFVGALRHRELKGIWEFAGGTLVLTDAKLGELETELLADGLDVMVWKNDSELVRYTFAKP